MQAGPDPMTAPVSFAARRPNASTLPSFELPSPQLAGFQKYQNYSNFGAVQPGVNSALTSVGNLLTPPTQSSADGLSPSGTVSNTVPAMMQQPYTPSSNSSMSYSSANPYGFQSSTQYSQQGRPMYSPQVGTLARSNSSPSTSELPPPPPYGATYHQYPASTLPMSAPPLSASQSQQMMSSAMIPNSITHSSPIHAQDTFTRVPSAPAYLDHSQQQSAPSYTYTSGPTPIQQSPVSAGPLSRPSPIHVQGPLPPAQSYPPRYNTYPGPVLSNVSNPAAGLALVGTMPHGMQVQYNSGHAAMQQMYQHPPAQNPQADRPFKCDQCPQSFNRNHDLKRHKRIHLAVKPFPCGHCDKSFSRKDALKVCTVIL